MAATLSTVMLIMADSSAIIASQPLRGLFGGRFPGLRAFLGVFGLFDAAACDDELVDRLDFILLILMSHLMVLELECYQSSHSMRHRRTSSRTNQHRKDRMLPNQPQLQELEFELLK